MSSTYKPRRCLWVFEGVTDERGRRVPAIVTEGAAGYCLTTYPLPADLDAATTEAHAMNARWGISQSAAWEIVASSFLAEWAQSRCGVRP